MSINKETVKKVAYLARLRLDDDKVAPLTTDLNNILNWVDQLQRVDTDGVEPFVSPVDMELPVRQDEVTDGAMPEKVLGNAPDKAHNMFLVPKVIE